MQVEGLPSWWKVALVLLAMVGLLGGFALTWQDKSASAATSLAAGVLLLLLSQLDRLETLKGWGFEARAKVKELDQKISEAEEIYARLAAVAKVVGHLSIESMVRVGRVSGPIPARKGHQLFNDLRSQLVALRVPPAEIELISAPWVGIVAFDLFLKGWQELKSIVDSVNGDIHEAFRRISQPINMEDPEYLNHLRRRGLAQEFQNELDVAIKAKWEAKAAALSDLLNSGKMNEVIGPHLNATTIAFVEAAIADVEAWVERRELRRPELYFTEDVS